jgi:threonine dehydrogenase-like Zn-dependent dehydrogenase
MYNKAIVGSVNSGPRHFRDAVDRLQELPEDALDALVTRIVDVEDFEQAFEDGDDIIKTAVEFDALE